MISGAEIKAVSKKVSTTGAMERGSLAWKKSQGGINLPAAVEAAVAAVAEAEELSVVKGAVAALSKSQQQGIETDTSLEGAAPVAIAAPVGNQQRGAPRPSRIPRFGTQA